MKSVYSAVRTGSLNSGMRLVFKGLTYTLRKNHKHTAASSVKQIANKYAGKYSMNADS
jgi:hypothetical protein